MKAFLLLFNKDERHLVKNIYRTLELVAPNTPDEIAAKVTQGDVFDVVVLDERFELNLFTSKRGGNSPGPVVLTDFIENARVSGMIAPNTVVVVLVAEGRTANDSMVYHEIGADVVLLRPIGSQDLQTKLEEILVWSKTPPAEFQLRRILRQLCAAERWADAAVGFEKLLTKKPDDLYLVISLARCLMKKNPPEAKRALEVLRGCEKRHPSSVSTKKMLVELALSEGSFEEAYNRSLEILALQPGASPFDACCKLADQMVKKSGTLDSIGSLLACIQNVNIPSLAPVLKEWTLQLLRTYSTQAKTMPDFEAMVGAMTKSIELRNELAPELSALYGRARVIPDMNGDLFRRLAQVVLEVDPGNGGAIVDLVKAAIATNSHDGAWKAIFRARDAKKNSAELFSAWAELALDEKNLREASDAIHAGRRLAPSNEVWDALSARWRELQKILNP